MISDVQGQRALETNLVSRARCTFSFPGGSLINLKHGGKLAFLLACGTIAASLAGGCTPFDFSYGNPIETEYPLEFKEGPKKSKEVVVALFVSCSPGMGAEFARCEVTLASDLAKILPVIAKKKNKKLSVIDPVQVNKFAMKTPNFTRMHPCEWGWSLGADFVVTVHLSKISLSETLPGSKTSVNEGHAEIEVDVFEAAAGPIQPKYHYLLPFNYSSLAIPDLATMPASRFKKDFLERLAVEISLKHFTHYVGEETHTN